MIPTYKKKFAGSKKLAILVIKSFQQASNFFVLLFFFVLQQYCGSYQYPLCFFSKKLKDFYY